MMPVESNRVPSQSKAMRSKLRLSMHQLSLSPPADAWPVISVPGHRFFSRLGWQLDRRAGFRVSELQAPGVQEHALERHCARGRFLQSPVQLEVAILVIAR